MPLMRCENHSAILLEGNRGFILVNHLQLGADSIKHDLPKGSDSQLLLTKEKKKSHCFIVTPSTS